VAAVSKKSREAVREVCALQQRGRARGDAANWGDPPGDATELNVEVLPPPTTHVVKVAEGKRWLETAATDPGQSVRSLG